MSHLQMVLYTECWSCTIHPLFLGVTDMVIKEDYVVGRIQSLSFNTYKLVFNQLTSFAVKHVFKMGLCHFHPKHMCVWWLMNPKMSKPRKKGGTKTLLAFQSSSYITCRKVNAKFPFCQEKQLMLVFDFIHLLALYFVFVKKNISPEMF